MPTYEYVCTTCHRTTEVVQGFSDPPLTECPHCGGRLKRVFHPVGIVLKGSGFYTTDNRSSRKGAQKPKEAATASSSESSGESKPADPGEPAAKPEKKTSTDPAKPKTTEKT